MAYFGAICFASMGGGGCRNCFQVIWERNFCVMSSCMIALISVNWEKESVQRPAPVQNFSLQKNGVHGGKISVVDMVFQVFIGFLCPPQAWKVFL